MPEEVDWHGQRAQIDAAVAAGTVKHVVLVSTMGTHTCRIPVEGHEDFLDKMGGGGLLTFKKKG